MRTMNHESVAKDLAKKANKLASGKSKTPKIEITLNGINFYISLNKGNIEFGSSEKEAEISAASSEDELKMMFLGVLSRDLSKNHLIEYCC